LIYDFDVVGMSLVYTRERNGERQKTSSTPVRIYLLVDIKIFVWMEKVRSFKNDWIILTMLIGLTRKLG
jgi:hypothetical protein